MTNPSSLLPKLISLSSEYFYLLKKEQGKDNKMDGKEKKKKKKMSQRNNFSHGYFQIFNYAS